MDDLAEQGRIDRRAYPRSLPPPPKFSWWMKIFMSRKMRELIEEVEEDEADLPA